MEEENKRHFYQKFVKQSIKLNSSEASVEVSK
jgi:hypothetical protein